MPPREGEDQIDLIIEYKLIDRIHEVEQPDEIELGIIVLQGCFQLAPLGFIFFRYLYIVFVIYIDDVQPWFEETEDRFHGMDGYGKVEIFKISQQHHIFGGSGYRIGGNDDHGYDPPSHDV